MIDLWYDFLGTSASDVSVSSAAGYCNDIICVTAIAVAVIFAVISVAMIIAVSGGRR